MRKTLLFLLILLLIPTLLWAWMIVVSGVNESGDAYTKLLLHMDADLSNGHEVTINGNPVLTPTSKFSQSLHFDGTGDYLSIPQSSDWSFGTGDFTIDFWAYRDTGETNFYAFSFYSSGADYAVQTTDLDSDGTKFSWYDGTWRSADYGSDMRGAWHHFAVVRNSGTFKIYIDGVAYYSTTGHTVDYISDGIFVVGAYRAPSVPAYTFTGYIDEFRVSKGIARWTSNFTPPTSPYTSDSYTKLLLHLDEDAGDAGSSGHHITTVNGDPDWSPTAKWNGSVYFDGTTDCLEIADSSDFTWGNGSFTIDFWIYADTPSVGTYLFEQRASGAASDCSIIIHLATDRTISLLMYSAAGNGNYQSEAIPANTWTHVACVRNGTSATIYINGSDNNTITHVDIGSNTLNDPNVSVVIGANGAWNSYSSGFNGYLDEYRISKGIARWTANFTPPSSPHTSDANTVLLLHLDGDVATGASPKHTVTFNGNPQMHTTTKWNGSLYFDGTGDYLSVPASEDFNFSTGDFTIDFWVYPNGGTDYNYFGIGGGGLSVQDFWHLSAWWTTTGDIYFAVRETGNWLTFVVSATTPLVASQWQHIAVVNNGGTLKIYHNGIEVASGVFTWNNAIANTITVGAFSIAGAGELYNNQYIDELRISKGIARWTANFTPPTAPY